MRFFVSFRIRIRQYVRPSWNIFIGFLHANIILIVFKTKLLENYGKIQNRNCRFELNSRKLKRIFGIWDDFSEYSFAKTTNIFVTFDA